MKEQYIGEFQTKAVPVSLEGFREGLSTAPWVDPFPRICVVGVGGYVMIYGKYGDIKTIKLDEVGSFEPGKKMLVFHKVPEKTQITSRT